MIRLVDDEAILAILISAVRDSELLLDILEAHYVCNCAFIEPHNAVSLDACLGVGRDASAITFDGNRLADFPYLGYQSPVAKHISGRLVGEKKHLS